MPCFKNEPGNKTMQNSDAVKAVWEAIDANPDYVVNLTRDLVRIPSVNPKFVENPKQNNEPAVQKRLQLELEQLGFACEQWDVFPGRPNLVGTMRGNEEKSLIL